MEISIKEEEPVEFTLLVLDEDENDHKEAFENESKSATNIRHLIQKHFCFETILILSSS